MKNAHGGVLLLVKLRALVSHIDGHAIFWANKKVIRTTVVHVFLVPLMANSNWFVND